MATVEMTGRCVAGSDLDTKSFGPLGDEFLDLWGEVFGELRQSAPLWVAANQEKLPGIPSHVQGRNL
jgi:hypothetical protein